MSTYQNFGDSGAPPAGNEPAGFGNPAYQTSGAPVGYDQPQTTDYSNYGAPHAEEGEFSVKSPRFILRMVQLLLSMIAFGTMASVSHYSSALAIDEAQYQVMISAGCFVYVILIVATDVLRVKARYFANIDVWEFAFDWMFFVLTFCGSLALAVKCNKTADPISLHYCEFFSTDDIANGGNSSSFHKAGASAAFGFLLSFVLFVSVILNYRTLTASRT